MFATEKGEELVVPKLTKEQREEMNKHAWEYIEAHLKNIERRKKKMNKKISLVGEPTKENYLKAIQDSCDYIKKNLAEKMLSDMEENKIKSIKFTILVEAQNVSIVEVFKNYVVEGEDENV